MEPYEYVYIPWIEHAVKIDGNLDKASIINIEGVDQVSDVDQEMPEDATEIELRIGRLVAFRDDTDVTANEFACFFYQGEKLYVEYDEEDQSLLVLAEITEPEKPEEPTKPEEPEKVDPPETGGMDVILLLVVMGYCLMAVVLLTALMVTAKKPIK